MSEAWADACRTAIHLAINWRHAGGVLVRAQPGHVRDRWLQLLRELMAETRFRRLPSHAGDDRLLGGLDLAASLAAGRAIADRGFLVEADGGIVILPMAERLPAATAARLAAVLDAQEVRLERDGLTLATPTRFGLIAFDESMAEGEGAPAALADRLAFHIDLNAVSLQDTRDVPEACDLAGARARLAQVDVPDTIVTALCAAAAALGIGSLRAPLLAIGAARAAAAFAGRTTVADEDAALAARLVLAPRATILPAAESAAESEPPTNAEDDQSEPAAGAEDRGALPDDVVLAAALAAIPAGLLAKLAAGGMIRSRANAGGRAGAMLRTNRRGRPIGARRGEPKGGATLNVIETLRAAAPWQALRRRDRLGDAPKGRVEVRRDDFRITRFKQRSETTTIFAVDASGSSAFHRLAEVKGAVELLLADCYVRRDRVALIAFRGTRAELLLPPTRSLVYAKRHLAGLPGGGQTPLAAGIDAAAALAESVRRGGQMPAIVLMTDGRANTTRDGIAEKPRAEAEALAAARAIAAAGTLAILVDTSPKPRPEAERLAAAMAARYVALPYAGAAALSEAIRNSVREAGH